MLRKALQYWKSILCSVSIFILSTMPSDTVKEDSWYSFQHADKIVHFIMYLTLSVIILSDYNKKNRPTIIKYIMVFVFAAIYGGIIEILQGTIFETRSADIYDFAVNMVGAISGCIIFFPLKDLSVLKL